MNHISNHWTGPRVAQPSFSSAVARPVSSSDRSDRAAVRPIGCRMSFAHIGLTAGAHMRSAYRTRIDRVTAANHDLIRLLNKPGRIEMEFVI